MTNDELRALDAEIHRRVFGREAFYDAEARATVEPLGGRPEKFARVPSYSGDIAAAWLVVGELRKRGHALLLDDLPAATPPQWFALFDLASGHDTGSVGCDTAPEAICRAALKAVART